MFSAILILVRGETAAHRGRLLAGIIALSVAGSMLLAAFVVHRAASGNAVRAAEELLGGDEMYLAAADPVRLVLDTTLVDGLRADPRVASRSEEHTSELQS